MKYLKHKEIDASKWDACLSKIVHCPFYALYDYLSHICSWDAIVLERDNEYLAVIPLPFKSKFGLKYLYQPFFCQQLGVFSNKTFSHNEELTILKVIRSRFIFGAFQWNHSLASSKDFTITVSPNYVLDLSRSYDEIKKAYNSNRKRNIKKNASFQDKIAITHDLSSLKEVVQNFKEELGHKFPEVETKHYDHIITGLQKSQSLSYSVVSVKDIDHKTLASALFVHFKKRSIYLLGYTKPDYIKSGVNSLIFDSFIKNQAENSSLLDFEGSKIAGIANFYKSFSAKDEGYYSYTLKLNLFFFLKRLG